ncbi:MAG: fibronectin type III domain-containing protein, partial [Blastocatellia bacterium]
MAGRSLVNLRWRHAKAFLGLAVLILAGIGLSEGVRAGAGIGMATLTQLVAKTLPPTVDPIKMLGSTLAPASRSLQTTTPSFYVLDNGNISIGGPNNSQTQNSVNSSGNLIQPYYRGNDGRFYKLTYSTLPLDVALGVGTGTNWTGSSVVENPGLTDQVFDYSGFNTTATLTGGGVKGYGVIVTRGKLSGSGLNGLEIQQTYSLGRFDNFIKIITQVRNTNATPTGNVHLWVGTRDDWVGNSDSNMKVRGNVVNGVFTPLTNASDRSQMVQITSGSEGVLFYSTTPGTNMIIGSRHGCCETNGFINRVVNRSPLVAWDNNPGGASGLPISITNDGAYGIYQLLGNIPANGSRFITWYYGAGSTVNLATVSSDLALVSAPIVVPGNAQATVSWTAPSTEQTITSYRIRYSIDNGQNWLPTADGISVSPVPNPLSYVLTGLTNGATYAVQVAAVTADGPGPFSNSSLVFIPGRPYNVVRPTLGGGNPVVRQGTPPVGTTLSVNDPNSNWINNGSQAMTTAYQWQADNVNISGATGTTFTVTSAQVGKVIRVQATRTNEFGSTSAVSLNSQAVASQTSSFNFPPVPNDQTVSTRQNTARSITLTGIDQENASLTFTTTIQPTNGTLSGTAPDLTYTPNTGFTGTDFFLFRANDGTQNSTVEGTITIRVTPVPAQLELATAPVPGPSGTSFTTFPSVRFLDAGGNVISATNDPVTVSILSGTGGTLVGATTVNAFNGVATFNGLGLAGRVGSSYVLQFTDGSLTVDSGPLTVTEAGPAAALVLTTAPVAGASGAPLAVQPVLEVQDSGGNLITGSTASVTVTIQSGTGGILGGTTTVNVSNGVATFSGLTLAGAPDTNYVLRFTSGSLSVDSGNLTVTTGAPSQLALTTAPVAGASGAALLTQPVVQIQDLRGNLVTNSTAAVTVAVIGTNGTLG